MARNRLFLRGLSGPSEAMCVTVSFHWRVCNRLLNLELAAQIREDAPQRRNEANRHGRTRGNPYFYFIGPVKVDGQLYELASDLK